MLLGLLDRLMGTFSIGRLVIVALLSRLVALYLLPSSPSFLAPDEGTYASLASWVADSKDVDSFPEFGPNLYNTSKTFILPAAALIRFGSDELTAVRVVSVVFGIACVYLFVRILYSVLGVKHLQEIKVLESQRIAFIGLCSYAFMPSSFLWSTLGLRESASTVTILASVHLLLRLRELRVRIREFRLLKKLLPFLILGTILILLSFGARPQTAIVFVFFFCISLLYMSRKNNFFFMSVVMISGTFLGLLFSMTPTTPVKTTHDSKVVITSSPVIADFVANLPLKNLDELEEKREANRVGAQTQILETKCTAFTSPSLQNLKCNLVEIPYRLLSILFRPLPFIDVGSLSNNLASAENIVWIFLFSIFAYSFVVSLRQRIKLHLTIPTAIFVVAFATLSALYEGNLGTAFRHKSTILWGLILVATVVLTIYKTDSEKADQKS